MSETSHTSSRAYPYPTPAGNALISEGPAAMGALADAISEEPRGEQDYLQAGVVQSTDWSFVAEMENSGTCALESEAVVGGVCWLPLTAIGLCRSVTTPAKLKALKPGSLPGPGKYLTVGFELTPTTSGAAATVTVLAGIEKASQAEAEASSPAVTAGKARIRDVVVLNTAGVYSIVSQRDRRSWARGAYAPLFHDAEGSWTVKSLLDVPISAVDLSLRVECSGAPVEVAFMLSEASYSESPSGLTVLVDGVSAAFTQNFTSGPGAFAPRSYRFVFTPEAGSHLFQPAWYGGWEAHKIGELVVSERIAAASNNGTA